MRFPRRTAFVTPVAPPHDSGQALIVGRILEGFEPDSYAVVTSMRPEEEAAHLPRLPGPVLRARRDPWRWSPWLALAARTLRVALALLRARARVVVGCSGRLLDLPAAFLAARLLRLPFHFWCFDDWLLQSTLERGHQVATRLERWIVRSARSIMVPCPFLADELRRRHGVEPVWLPNPYYDGPVAEGSGGRLVFTGQVYAAHLDALDRVVRALDLLDRPDLRLDVYSGFVAPGALDDPRVAVHPHLAPREAAGVQRGADVLVLALAFRSPYPELIRTSCPSKLSDYLRSGRPVLVHAPEGSFAACYVREWGCGLVVDREDPAALAEALRTLLDDRDLADRLGRRARECAEDFSPGRSRRALVEAVSR